jgi:hypothetical protein
LNYTIAQSQLQPNFAEIEFVTDEINIYATQYSSDLFKECISEQDSGYFFYRDGDRIFALPEKENLSRPIGFDEISISSREVPYVFSRLIDIAFKLLFESLGRKVYRKKYSSLSIFQITSEDSYKIGDLE